MAIIPELQESIRELLSLQKQAADTNAVLRETNQLTGAGGKAGLSQAGQFSSGGAAQANKVVGRTTDAAEEEVSSITPGRIKKGFRRITSKLRAAVGLYEIEMGIESIDALTNRRDEQDFKRNLEKLDDEVKLDPNTGQYKRPQLQRLKLEADHAAEQANKKIALIESLAYFTGPVGRATAFIAGTVARAGIAYGQRDLEKTGEKAEAEQVFREEHLYIRKGPRKPTRTQEADAWIAAGGDVKALSEDVERVKKHAMDGLKLVELGDTARAQSEYDEANKIEQRNNFTMPWSPTHENPVSQYFRMDRARAAIRVFSMYQQMAPNLRTGE